MSQATVVLCLLTGCASVSVGVTQVGSESFPENPEWEKIPVYVSQSLLDPKSEWVPVVQISASGNANADWTDVTRAARKAAAPYGVLALVVLQSEERERINQGFSHLARMPLTDTFCRAVYVGFRRK